MWAEVIRDDWNLTCPPRVLSEGHGHGGPGVCPGDGQTEAEGVPLQGECGDALLRRMPPHLTWPDLHAKVIKTDSLHITKYSLLLWDFIFYYIWNVLYFWLQFECLFRKESAAEIFLREYVIVVFFFFRLLHLQHFRTLPLIRFFPLNIVVFVLPPDVDVCLYFDFDGVPDR